MPLTAFLFPGQGSQFIGMGKDLAASHPAAARIFEKADEVLGFRLSRLCWEGPSDELTRTINTQPAVVVTSLACLAALEQEGVVAGVTAGHSVGELSALAAAGVLAPEAAVLLARTRGELMEASGQKRPGTMAAILGLNRETIVEVCRLASSTDVGTVVLANINAPEQLVISGDLEAMKRAEELAFGRGARRVIHLTVGGAFHSPLMQDAADLFAAELDAVDFSAPRIPVFSCVTTRPVDSAADLKALLKVQMTSQVQWEDTMRHILDMNPAHMIEVGPGTSLSGMLKRVSRNTEPLRVSDTDTLHQAVSRVLKKTP